jgi:predicted amino acid-binding ACT domain protein
MHPMRRAISIFGHDRPGIIASITENLVNRGANIEDASMTLLQDHFAMILVVNIEGLDENEFRNLLGFDNDLADLSISLSDELDDDHGVDDHKATRYIFHLAVSDTPGIVARVTRVLARHGANVVDCATRKNNDTGLFTMILDVDVPGDMQEKIVDELSDATKSYSGDVVFQRVDDVDL